MQRTWSGLPCGSWPAPSSSGAPGRPRSGTAVPANPRARENTKTNDGKIKITGICKTKRLLRLKINNTRTYFLYFNFRQLCERF